MVGQVKLLALAFHPDGRCLVAGGADPSLQVWDVDGQKMLAAAKHHQDRVLALDWSRDGQHIASGGQDGSLLIWARPAPGSLDVAKSCSLGSPVAAVAFGPDSSLLASADGGGQVRLWTVPGGEARAMLASHQGGAAALPGRRSGTCSPPEAAVTGPS